MHSNCYKYSPIPFRINDTPDVLVVIKNADSLQSVKHGDCARLMDRLMRLYSWPPSITRMNAFAIGTNGRVNSNDPECKKHHFHPFTTLEIIWIRRAGRGEWNIN